MVRVGPSKASRGQGSSAARRACENDDGCSGRKDVRVYSLSALEKSSTRVPQGRRSRFGKNAYKSRASMKTKTTLAMCGGGGGGPSSSSRLSEDSFMSGGSDGLDCLCNAVELELSGGGRDTEMRCESDDDDVCCNAPSAAAAANAGSISHTSSQEHAERLVGSSGVTTVSREASDALMMMESEKENRESHLESDTETQSHRQPGTRSTYGSKEEPTKTGARLGGVIVPTTKRARMMTDHTRVRRLDLEMKNGKGVTHTGSSAFEVVAPRVAAARYTMHGSTGAAGAPAQLRAVPGGLGSVAKTAQEQLQALWQIQRLQCTIAAAEHKYGKGFPEVGRMYLSLARLFSSVSRREQALFCLTRSWETFKANFSVSRSPLSCISAYRSIFEEINGGPDPVVDRQMASMEAMVGAVRRATAVASDMKIVGSVGKRAAASFAAATKSAAARAPPSTPRKTPGEKQARFMSKIASPLSPRSARANIAANTQRTLMAA